MVLTLLTLALVLLVAFQAVDQKYLNNPGPYPDRWWDLGSYLGLGAFAAFVAGVWALIL